MVKDLISVIAEEKRLEEIAYNLKVPPEDIPDLCQEGYLSLLVSGNDFKGMEERGELDYYLTKMIKNMYFSTTSRYYYNIKRYEDKIDRNADINDKEGTENAY